MSARSPVPVLGSALPQSGGKASRAFGRLLLRRLGWHVEGDLPNIPKAVLILAPHTSNWDFVVGIAAKFAMGLHASWLGKHALFRPPFGFLMRRLGGFPVDRRESRDAVAQAVNRFANTDRFVLGVAPEGTRKAVSRWRTGYYHFAAGARVPIVPVAFHWPRHALVVGTPLLPGTDMAADLHTLAEFYVPMRGRHGERAAPPG